MNCPQCGFPIEQKLRVTGFFVCPACNSSLTSDNGALENAGKMALIPDEPSLFQRQRRYRLAEWLFTPVGRIRYEYGGGDGYWDEWYVLGDNGSTNWVTVDEGEVAIESLVAESVKVPAFAEVRVGEIITITKLRLTVIEKDICRCIGAEGELPFPVNAEESYPYLDLLAPKRVAFTIEYQHDGAKCFRGKWVDPFDIIEA